MIDELTVGIVTAILAIFTTGYGIFKTRQDKARERRERTTALYSEFYDRYREVALPVYKLAVKMRGLPKSEWATYRDMLSESWSYQPDPKAELAHYVSAEERALSPAQAHFHHRQTGDEFTEHDALVAFLYFWVRVERLIKANLVDGQLFADLFCNSFAYYDDLLDELRDAVEEKNAGGPKPAWVDATRTIEALIDEARCAA